MHTDITYFKQQMGNIGVYLCWKSGCDFKVDLQERNKQGSIGLREWEKCWSVPLDLFTLLKRFEGWKEFVWALLFPVLSWSSSHFFMVSLDCVVYLGRRDRASSNSECILSIHKCIALRKFQLCLYPLLLWLLGLFSVNSS